MTAHRVAGAPRRASQRRSRPAVPARTAIAPAHRWQPGDRVKWRGRSGLYMKPAEDDAELGELLIAGRRYRVALSELSPA